MRIEGKRVLVTGASGGIGQALVAAFLEAGAAEVVAASRRLVAPAPQLRPAALDVTEPASVAALAAACGAEVDILVNNAGVNGNCGALAPADREAAWDEMEVNYFGLLRMLRAFAPAMTSRGSGVIVNMLTMLAHANLPMMGSYCASKAAAWSLTQAARAELAGAGVRVVAVFPSSVDTAMSARATGPKLAPAEVAGEVVRAVQEGLEDVYPGPVARDFAAALRQDPKALERRLAARLPAG